MTCPVCEKRAAQEQKAASDCKQEVKQLEAKSARLTIVLTVLGTLVGKELLDKALAITDSVTSLSAAPVVEQDVVYANPAQPNHAHTNSEPKQWASANHTDFSVTENLALFPNVPPLTPRLWQQSSANQFAGLYFEDHIVVPDTMAPLFLTAMLRPWKGRKRND
jgi:hypothetical protein|tara:strand:- start:17 stop:508 length:492 start_codon:yes stop_codon:yes gene_type:complete